MRDVVVWWQEDWGADGIRICGEVALVVDDSRTRTGWTMERLLDGFCHIVKWKFVLRRAMMYCVYLTEVILLPYATATRTYRHVAHGKWPMKPRIAGTFAERFSNKLASPWTSWGNSDSSPISVLKHRGYGLGQRHQFLHTARTGVGTGTLRCVLSIFCKATSPRDGE